MNYLLRVCLLLCAIFFLDCAAPPKEKPNQKQGFTSPSGRYILNVPIETDSQDQQQYWRVTISDPKGTMLFKDDSSFVANLNVYWYWDKDDRVWLRNSDDGKIYYWESDKNGQWLRTQWNKNNAESLAPPAELSSEYWRDKK
jgi:hypothetical protein